MTYGYGDTPGGWRPPSEPDPPARGRRVSDPDDLPEEDPGGHGDRGGERAFQAPPPPPVYDPPVVPATSDQPEPEPRDGPGREPTVYGRHAVGRAVPPAPPPAPLGPGRPVSRDAGRARPQDGAIPPYGRPLPDQRPPHDPRTPGSQGGLTDRYVPRRGGVYGGGGPGFGAPPQQPSPAPQPSPALFGAPPAPQPFGPPQQFGAAQAPQPFGPPRQFAPDRAFPPEQFTPPDRRAPERPEAHPEARPEADRRLPATLWKSILGGVVIIALLVIVGVGAFAFVHRGNAAGRSSPPPKHDISSQAVDPAPLTEAEVFPGPAVGASQTDAGYQVVKTEATADCKAAAVGDLPAMLASQGCTQVVRATLTSADKAFVVTIGLLNLRDQAGATAAEEAVKASVTGGKGRFTGLATGGPSDVIGKVATQLGWDSRGHFLAYAVVARADGTTIAAGDPTVTKIINALVEDYLKGTVLQARVDARPSSGPAPTGGAKAPSGRPTPSPSRK